MSEVSSNSGVMLAAAMRPPQVALSAALEPDRFPVGIVVSQKVAAQAVPVLGAISGAAVNSLFVDFQTLARGHFTVRRLERIYGRGTVRSAYDQIRARRSRPAADS
jgi:EcsC protein family